MPQGAALKRRITRGFDGGLIEDMHVNKYLAKLYRMETRSFRWPTDIEAEVFVGAMDESEGIQRVRRYLSGCPRIVTKYVWQEEPNNITVLTESNWAACKDTRKSTSGGCFMHGKHIPKT